VAARASRRFLVLEQRLLFYSRRVARRLVAQGGVNMIGQRRWQRTLLLTVLGYEGLGALVGGSSLVARPDGRYMNIPVGLMHGVFSDFLVPGVVLFGLGLLNVAGFFMVLRRSRWDWAGAGLALGALTVWFFVEIAILRELHWLHVMWGFPVILGGLVALPLLPFRPTTMRDAWLVSGVVSSFLYVAMNIVVPMQWPGYSWEARTVSELSAIGAPTRPLWVVMGLCYTLLVMAFGWGVRLAAGDNGRLRLAGILIVIYGALGVVWPFAPMHLREVLAQGGGSPSDQLHIAFGVATEVLYLLALGCAAAVLGKAFRLYSIATFVAVFAFAIPMFREAPRVGANQSTPFIGVWERINIGVFLLWIVVLALALLIRAHAKNSHASPHALPEPA
jgi:hypothetical protein